MCTAVDAGVRIGAPDRAGLERLPRYRARPPFAMDRLKQRGADLVYRCGKGRTHDGGPLPSDKYSGELLLTPLELIDRIAHLLPPLRTHRHRGYGVLAPKSPLRGAVPAMALDASVVPPEVGSPVTGDAHTDPGTAVAATGADPGTAIPSEPQAKPKPHSPSHYLWAALIARIYEVFALICPMCGGQCASSWKPQLDAPEWAAMGCADKAERCGSKCARAHLDSAKKASLWLDCGLQG